MIQPLVFLT